MDKAAFLWENKKSICFAVEITNTNTLVISIRNACPAYFT